MTAVTNLPDLRPSLLLDFANSGRADPRIQCTRASSATCFGPDGKLRTVAANVPRIDYDPATGKCLGLLVESQRSNLLINSFALSGYGQGANGTYSAGRIGIDGITPSMRVVANASGLVFLTRAVAVAAGTYTASIYFCADAKPTGGNLLRVEEIQADGSKIAKGFSLAHASIVADGKWRRYDLTVTHAAAGLSNVFFAVDPNVGASIDVCAAQYEAGAKASSYIPTAASAVTRAADVCKIDGVSFTSWYRQDEGTFFVEYSLADATGIQRVLVASNGSMAQRVSLLSLSGCPELLVASNSVNTVELIDPAVKLTAKVAGAYARNSSAMSANGAASAVDEVCEMPTLPLTRLDIGHQLGGEQISGTIARIAYYPKRISNDQLKRLTA